MMKADTRIITTHLSFTVINLVILTEPLEMLMDRAEHLSWEVSKSRARINKANIVILGVFHKVIVHTYPIKSYSEVFFIQHISPINFFLKMSCAIITSKLDITSVFADTHAKHSLFNKSLFVEDLVDGTVQSSLSTTSHAKDSISFLCIEKICFFFYTAECVFKTIFS